MDGSRFDLFTRALTRAVTRRQGMAIAVAALAGGAVAADAAAAPRTICRPSGSGCTRGSQCCTSYCETGRSAPRRQRNRCGCAAGLGQCGTACVDLASDPANCGDCGVVCVGQEICLSGDCICIPDCDGKVCGSDGCGGTCGACDTGMICLDDQSACAWPCDDWDAAVDPPYCSASIAGVRLDAYAYHDTFATCTADSDCQSHSLCDNPAYDCQCQYSVRDAEDYPDGEFWGTGYCIVLATARPTCYDGGIEGKTLCGTDIEGESFGFTSWAFDGRFGINGGKCTSNQTCIDKAAECTNAGQRCFCEAASWDDGFFFRDNLNKAYCYRVTI